MKITFVMPGYPKKPVGGYRIIFQYANELASRGHDLTIVFPAILKKAPIPKGLNNHIKWFVRKILYSIHLPDAPKIDWQIINPKVKMMYVHDLDEKYIPNSEIIIATAWQTAEWVNIYPKDKGRKYYFIQHYETWGGPKDRVDKTWLFSIKKIVIATWLKKVGEQLNAKNITVVPNAIDHGKFYITKNINDRNRKISMLYHKSDWKGSLDGIKAIEIVKDKFPDLETVFFGVSKRGNEIPEWIDYVQEPSQEYLRENIYNTSSIFVCPSWKEGWGLPASESMACGCALVSTDNGGVNDFAINNKTALLSPVKDPQKLANNITKLLLNDNLRIKLAKSGSEAIKMFRLDKSVSLFEKTLFS